MRRCGALLCISHLILAPFAIAQAAGMLQGRVAIGGLPIEGAIVSVFREDNSKSARSANIVTSTLQDGTYTLTLSEGTYIEIVTIAGQLAYQGEVQLEPNRIAKKDILLDRANPAPTAGPSSNCIPVFSSPGIHENSFMELPPDSGLDGVFVYASGIHRFKNHPEGNWNKLFVLVYEPTNPSLGEIREQAKKGQLAVGKLMKTASSLKQLTYKDKGSALSFDVRGKTFTLTVTEVNHRLGSGTQFMKISVCRQ